MKLGIYSAGFLRIAQALGIEDTDLELAESGSGVITLYHRTSPEAADAIVSQGRFLSRENTGEVFFSSRVNEGQTEGYGEAVVSVEIPVEYVRLDDEFGSGEVHVAIEPQNFRYVKNIQRIQ